MVALLLAAGTSSRLGEPKQLVRLNGETLLLRTVRLSFDSCEQVHVVIGHVSPDLQNEMAHIQTLFPSVYFHACPDWAAGMGTSLAFGLKQIRQSDVCVFLCDLPFIRLEHLQKLQKALQDHLNQAIVSRFQGQASPPVIIPQVLQPQFYDWSGDRGLGAYWKQHPEACYFVDFDTEYRDLDTPEDKEYWTGL